ncbi:MAG: tRNA pseudouridine(55) synthase TruB [Endomicrobium sp.]|jgi:tRNA pseudouridine55 synthase|nr:tRNA pseudouridine(55) synthase TruB [Endomicrobium sp.]
MNNANIIGLLLLDKPKGVTSFKAITKLKLLLNLSKVGHCGTLDPNATGLLLVLVGIATKFQYQLTQTNKVYFCSFILGITSTTDDVTGIIIRKEHVSNIDIKKMKKIFSMFEGNILQIPPMYSAVKYHGKKLYEFARHNVSVQRMAKRITIYKIDFLSCSANIVYIKVNCSKGTYIRSLVRDIGKIYGCGAVVKDLRRYSIGQFTVKDALTFQIFNNNTSKLIHKNEKYFITYNTLLTWRKNKYFEQDKIY